MNARTIALHESMQRIALVVDSIPALRERAAESNAFRLFSHDIAEFDDIRNREAVLHLESERLKLQVQLLVKRVMTELACIDAAAQLAPRAACLSSLKVRCRSHRVMLLYSEAQGILSIARKNAATLIAAGMHPRKLDDLQCSLVELVAVHTDWCMSEAQESTLPVRLSHLVVRSRARIRQLYFELAPAMTSEFRATWKVAASLGRTHRPKQLLAGSQPRLLTSGTTDASAEAVEETAAEVEQSPNPLDAHTPAVNTNADSKSVIGRLAQRVVQRIVGGDEELPAPS